MSFKNEKETSKSFKYELEILLEGQDSYDLAFKIVLVGDASNYISFKLFLILIIIIEVGKSCLSLQTKKKGFEENYESTVGFEFFTSNICLNKENIIRLQIWDTSGNEIYRSLISNFYRSASLAIIVYAIDE